MLRLIGLTCIVPSTLKNYIFFCLLDAQTSDGQRIPSFNEELNGLLGAGILANNDHSAISQPTRTTSTDISTLQDTQIMWAPPPSLPPSPPSCDFNHIFQSECIFFDSVVLDLRSVVTSVVTNVVFFSSSCLSGDDSSTCIPITANNVEIVSSEDSSISSKARGSSKVRWRVFD